VRSKRSLKKVQKGRGGAQSCSISWGEINLEKILDEKIYKVKNEKQKRKRVGRQLKSGRS